MSVKLLANENFPAPAIRRLRAEGVDVLSVAEIMPASSDAEVLAFARQEGRWIVTFDRDYGDMVIRHRMPPRRRFFTCGKRLIRQRSRLSWCWP